MSSSPFTDPQIWNAIAAGYVKVTAPLLGHFSEDAIEWARLSSSDRVFDLACGPGTLTTKAAPLVNSITGVDFAPQMVEAAQKAIQEAGLNNVVLEQADGQQKFGPGDEYDVAFSMFGLMLFADRVAGLKNLKHLLKPGGRVYLSTWPTIEHSPYMKLAFEAFIGACPENLIPDRPIGAFDNPEIVEEEMGQAGFKAVEVVLKTHALPVKAPEAIWQELSEGNVLVDLVRKQLGDEPFSEVRKKTLENLNALVSKAPEKLDFAALLATGVA